MSGKEGPCRTPGAVYETRVGPANASIEVQFPRDVIAELSAEEKVELIHQLHDAVLPVIEHLYSRTWVELFAGKPLPDHVGVMPKRHEDL